MVYALGGYDDRFVMVVTLNRATELQCGDDKMPKLFVRGQTPASHGFVIVVVTGDLHFEAPMLNQP